MTSSPKHIIIAAGGTGGHVFPAQALAEHLQELDANSKLLFMGKGLSSNPYFYKERFESISIHSATPFKKGLVSKAFSLLSLLKGIGKALYEMHVFKPHLVVGFGSYHAFPVLAAAWIKRVPIVLFESNSIPGKVTRVFSGVAVSSGVQFPEAKKKLKGRCFDVKPPLWKGDIHAEDPFTYFGLQKGILTLLVFGGSQGAFRLNSVIAEAVQLFGKENKTVQVIHLTGAEESAISLQESYQKEGIVSYVRSFEKNMKLAWSIADLVICRAGALSIAEMMEFEVPGILIPYPYAADQHQLGNALFVEKTVGGAICLEEKDLSVQKAFTCLKNCDLHKMKRSLQDFKKRSSREELSHWIINWMKLNRI